LRIAGRVVRSRGDAADVLDALGFVFNVTAVAEADTVAQSKSLSLSRSALDSFFERDLAYKESLTELIVACNDA
jgi:hypothetical protein